MDVLNIIVYVTALITYCGFIAFAIVGIIRAYRNYKKENNARWTMLYEYLEMISQHTYHDDTK